MRNLFYFIHQVHKGTMYITVPFGTLTAIDMNQYKFSKKSDISFFEGAILVAPEATVGAVSGFFWIYTLPFFSAYRRYLFNNLQ